MPYYGRRYKRRRRTSTGGVAAAIARGIRNANAYAGNAARRQASRALAAQGVSAAQLAAGQRVRTYGFTGADGTRQYLSGLGAYKMNGGSAGGFKDLWRDNRNMPTHHFVRKAPSHPTGVPWIPGSTLITADDGGATVFPATRAELDGIPVGGWHPTAPPTPRLATIPELPAPQDPSAISRNALHSGFVGHTEQPGDPDYTIGHINGHPVTFNPNELVQPFVEGAMAGFEFGMKPNLFTGGAVLNTVGQPIVTALTNLFC